MFGKGLPREKRRRAPFHQRGPFDFGDKSHLAAGVDWLGRMVRERRSGAFGLTALLYRLRARVDVGELMEHESRILHSRG